MCVSKINYIENKEMFRNTYDIEKNSEINFN